MAACEEQVMYALTSSSTRPLVYLFLLSGGSRSHTRNRTFKFSADSIKSRRCIFITFHSVNLSHVFRRSSLFTFHLSASRPLASCTSHSHMWTISCLCSYRILLSLPTRLRYLARRYSYLTSRHFLSHIPFAMTGLFIVMFLTMY